MKAGKKITAGTITIMMLATAAFVSCSGQDIGTPLECEFEPEILTTAEGVRFVRTPEDRFEDLPDFPYEAKYVEIDGLRQGYVDEGPAEADPVLLLHGQPTWSYLYRKMIPVLTADANVLSPLISLAWVAQTNLLILSITVTWGTLIGSRSS